MKKVLIPAALAIVLASCSSSSNKMEQMTNDMCGCFNKIRDSLPADALKLFHEASTAPKAWETYLAGVKELPEASFNQMNSALMLVTKPGSAVKTCLEEMDKKYKSIGGDKTEITRKMVELLEKDKEGDHDIMLALLRMELEKQAAGLKK